MTLYLKREVFPIQSEKSFFFACYARRLLSLDQRIRVHILPDPRSRTFKDPDPGSRTIKNPDHISLKTNLT